MTTYSSSFILANCFLSDSTSPIIASEHSHHAVVKLHAKHSVLHAEHSNLHPHHPLLHPHHPPVYSDHAHSKRIHCR